MPCSDNRPSSDYEQGYKSGKRESDSTINSLKGKITNLEAVLCAITNELNRRGVREEVIQEAEDRGDIKISDILKYHIEQDKIRLRRFLATYLSQDEMDLIDYMVKKGELDANV